MRVIVTEIPLAIPKSASFEDEDQGNSRWRIMQRVEREEPAEIELRQDLQELQRKSEALKRVFPASNKAEIIVERMAQEWSDRLKVERQDGLRAAVDDEKARQVNERFDQLQDGLEKAVKAIGAGKEPDLTFTIRPEPRLRKAKEMER